MGRLGKTRDSGLMAGRCRRGCRLGIGLTDITVAAIGAIDLILFAEIQEDSRMSKLTAITGDGVLRRVCRLRWCCHLDLVKLAAPRLPEMILVEVAGTTAYIKQRK